MKTLCTYQCQARGGGGPRAYVGHLIPFAISALGNLTESLGPWVGTFDCFGEVDWALISSSFRPKSSTACYSKPTPVSEHFNLPGHSVHDIRLIPLEYILTVTP